MATIKSRTAQIREKRLQATGAFYGSLLSLLNEIRSGDIPQRIRTFSQDTASDLLYALQLLNTFQQAAIVIHGPKGCAAAQPYFNAGYSNEIKWAVTNLNERDSIMGSDRKLRDTILNVFKSFAPAIIFVFTTPVVAINNDDVESVVEELQDQLNIKIIPIYTDAFKSRIGITGYDLAVHALLKSLLPVADIDNLQQDFINLISISESQDDLTELQRILSALKIAVNIFPKYASVGNVIHSKHAKFSIAVNHDEAFYAGDVLQSGFNVPYHTVPIPVGIAQTAAWIKEISSSVGVEANDFIAKEKSSVQEFIENKKYRFQQKKIFINHSPSYAFALLEIVTELGFQVVGVKVPYIDMHHTEKLAALIEKYGDLHIIVGEGQLFEEINLLKKNKPDIYLGHTINSLAIAGIGISVVDVQSVSLLGFKGVYHLVTKLEKVIENTSFLKYLSQHKPETYLDNWLKKSANWHIKLEVK